MLKVGIIGPSPSPWTSPIVIIEQEGWLQKILRGLFKWQHSRATPGIYDILVSLDRAKYFTCLDLRSGYWQIPVDPATEDKTAFTCFLGLYRFIKVPFAIFQAPSLFSELMKKVLQGIEFQLTMAKIRRPKNYSYPS